MAKHSRPSVKWRVVVNLGAARLTLGDLPAIVRFRRQKHIAMNGKTGQSRLSNLTDDLTEADQDFRIVGLQMGLYLGIGEHLAHVEDEFQ